MCIFFFDFRCMTFVDYWHISYEVEQGLSRKKSCQCKMGLTATSPRDSYTIRNICTVAVALLFSRSLELSFRHRTAFLKLSSAVSKEKLGRDDKY